MSSSRGSRPASCAAAAIGTQTAGPKHAVKRSSIAGRRHGGVHLLDLVAERRPAARRRRARRARRRGSSVGVERRERRDADPQPARLARRRRARTARRRRRPRRVAGLGAGEDVEQQRRLAHGARQDAVLQEEALAGVGRQRDAPARRLEADEAAAGGRDAQRAAAVVAVGDRDHAGGDGGRRAAGRAAGRALEVPRVARRAEAPRLGDRQDPPLRQRRRADDDEARVAQPAHDAVVVRGDERRP